MEGCYHLVDRLVRPGKKLSVPDL